MNKNKVKVLDELVQNSGEPIVNTIMWARFGIEHAGTHRPSDKLYREALYAAECELANLNNESDHTAEENEPMLTKLEVSECIGALEEVRDSIQQNLKDGKYIVPDVMEEMVAEDTALIDKLNKIWKSMK